MVQVLSLLSPLDAVAPTRRLILAPAVSTVQLGCAGSFILSLALQAEAQW